MGSSWVASCRNRGQRCPRFPKRRAPRLKLMRIRRRTDEKPTSERLLPLLLCLLQQALIYERGNSIQHLECTFTEGAVEGLDRPQCAAANKDGHTAEETLLFDIQQIITPSYCAAQSLPPPSTLPHPTPHHHP